MICPLKGKNKFTGTLPDAIGGFSGMWAFDLCVNIFRGALPEGLRTMSRLKNLILHQDLLSGALPLVAPYCAMS